MGRGDLTNAEWDRLQSFSPRGGARGGRWSDHRRVIDGVLHRVRMGPWAVLFCLAAAALAVDLGPTTVLGGLESHGGFHADLFVAVPG